MINTRMKARWILTVCTGKKIVLTLDVAGCLYKIRVQSPK